MAEGRSSFRFQPDSTTARARSPRMKRSFKLSTSKTERLLRVSLSTTRLTPLTGFQAMLDGLRVERAIASFHFQHHRFGAARAILQIVHRIGRHQLALVDDDHLLAGLFHFRQDVRAQDDGVIARQAADQIARFVDLLGVEARRWVRRESERRGCG